MNVYSVSLLCFGFGVLLVAVLALTKRKDLIAIRFLFFSIAVFGWGFIEAFWFNQSYSQSVCLALMRISNAFAIWIPMTWFHFVLDLIGKKEPVKYFYLCNYLIAVVLTVFSQSHFFISGTHAVSHFHSYTSPGPLFHVFTINFFILVPLAFVYLIKAYRLKDARHSQFACVIIATVFGFMAGSSTFFPVYKIAVPLFLMPLMVLYPFFMGLALIKYGLFDTQQIADAFQREKMTALGVMAASLNHEMRNPLYIAKGRIEGYRAVMQHEGSTEVSGKTKEVIDSVFNQLDRTLDIMQRFSDFAKPFNAQKEKQTFELAALFKEVRELVAYALETRKIVLKDSIPSGLTIQCNRRQLEEVLFNLVMNAIQALKHREQGGEIEVSAEQTKQNIRIQVKDNGPGIDEEGLRHIFEPFYTTKEKGTGLGLYITKQLVERNGGKVEVRSKDKEGTLFILTFKASGSGKSSVK